jgi:hypothetical protein
MARKKRRVDDDVPKKKKKAAPRDEEYDDLDEEYDDLDEEHDDLDEDPDRPRNDAYTGMLVITLASLIAACVFFFLDHGALTAQTVQAPSVTVPPLGAGQQPAGKG